MEDNDGNPVEDVSLSDAKVKRNLLDENGQSIWTEGYALHSAGENAGQVGVQK